MGHHLGNYIGQFGIAHRVLHVCRKGGCTYAPRNHGNTQRHLEIVTYHTFLRMHTVTRPHLHAVYLNNPFFHRNKDSRFSRIFTPGHTAF